MSAGEWIQLFVHPEDAEIQRLAELTGRSPEVCFAAVIRWFWHVDRKCDGPNAGMSAAGLHRICRWRSRLGKATLVTAMQDGNIKWLALAPDGTLLIPNFEKHFGRNAKRRITEARRKMSARYADMTRTKSGHDADKKRTRCAPTTTTTTTVIPPPIPPPKKTAAKKPKPDLVTARTASELASAAMAGVVLRTQAFQDAWDAWVAWCLVDPARKSGYTTHALKAQVRKLERMGHDDAIAALENATGRWQGVFEPRGRGSGAQVPSRQARSKAPPGKYDKATGVAGSAFAFGGADD